MTKLVTPGYSLVALLGFTPQAELFETRVCWVLGNSHQAFWCVVHDILIYVRTYVFCMYVCMHVINVRRQACRAKAKANGLEQSCTRDPT